MEGYLVVWVFVALGLGILYGRSSAPSLEVHSEDELITEIKRRRHLAELTRRAAKAADDYVKDKLGEPWQGC